jgi:hypothetical protein
MNIPPPLSAACPTADGIIEAAAEAINVRRDSVLFIFELLSWFMTSYQIQ